MAIGSVRGVGGAGWGRYGGGGLKGALFWRAGGAFV